MLLRFIVGLLILAPLGAQSAPPSRRGRVHTDVPDKPDPARRWLFYVHGHIVEVQGRQALSPTFGRYEYDAILQALAGRGFEVIAEIREPGSGPSFAAHLASQVRKLRAAGVPAEHVGVVGASRGGFYTLRAAAELQDPALSFVVLASCGPATLELAPRLRGRILSIYDQADEPAVSCRKSFDKAPQLEASRELVVRLGRSHGLVFRPYPEWVEPATEWLK